MYLYIWMIAWYIFLFSPFKTKSIASVRPFLTDCNSCARLSFIGSNASFMLGGRILIHTGSLWRIAWGHYDSTTFFQTTPETNANHWWQSVTNIRSLYRMGPHSQLFSLSRYYFNMFNMSKSVSRSPFSHNKIHHWKSFASEFWGYFG